MSRVNYTLATMVKSLGYTSIKAQALTAPPYVFACMLHSPRFLPICLTYLVFCLIAIAKYSDKYRCRTRSLLISCESGTNCWTHLLRWQVQTLWAHWESLFCGPVYITATYQGCLTLHSFLSSLVIICKLLLLVRGLVPTCEIHPRERQPWAGSLLSDRHVKLRRMVSEWTTNCVPSALGWHHRG